MNKKIRYFLCGLAMGAADTVPGVSGGTIAFITGIYENLLNAIKSINLKFFKLFFKGSFKSAFSMIPWDFCIPLLLGIFTAIITLANVVVILLKSHPNLIWAFFFGLIVASLDILARDLYKAKGNMLISICFAVFGFIFTYWLTHSSPITLSHSYPSIFFSGFIAICAMILPGISGAFVLVLLGQYHFILQSLTSFNLSIIFIFLSGCVCGLLSFAHIISACLKNFYKPSLAFLSGILAGSLITLNPFSAKNMAHTQESTFVLLTLITIGFLIPLLIHRLGQKNSKY